MGWPSFPRALPPRARILLTNHTFSSSHLWLNGLALRSTMGIMDRVIPKEYRRESPVTYYNKTTGEEYDCADDDWLVIKLVAFLGIIIGGFLCWLARTWTGVLYVIAADLAGCTVLAVSVLWV